MFSDNMITHPDEGAVGVLPGRSAGHNGGGRWESSVHRDKSNSKPIQIRYR